MKASFQTQSEHDFELLSAYLDGELTHAEREALEKRLSDDIQLRAALNDLRNTTRLIHNLPHLKAPRDFTLDPAIYGRKPAWWQRGMLLQLSGALGAAASLVLIVLALLYGQSTQTREQDAAPLTEPPQQQSDAVAVIPSPTITLLATATQPIMTANAGEEYDGAAESESAAPSADQGFYAPTQELGIAQAAPNAQYSTNGDTGPSVAAGAAAPAAPTATMKMIGTTPPEPAAALEMQESVMQPTGVQNQNAPEMPPAADAQDSAAFKDKETEIPTQVAQETVMREVSTVEASEHDETGRVKHNTRTEEEKDYRWLAVVGAMGLIGSLGLVLLGRRNDRRRVR